MNGNFDQNKLFNEIVKKTGGKINESSINKAKKGDMSDILSALPKEERETLKKALSDKEAAKKILSSKKAQDILNSFLRDKNNG